MTEQQIQLPEGWELTTLGESFKWGSGGTPKKGNPAFYNGDIPWLIIADLNDGYVLESKTNITELGLNNSSAKLVPENSVLLAMYGSIGKLGITTKPVATNQAIAFTSPINDDPKYLFYYLMTVRNKLAKLGKGATQLNISQTVIKAFPYVRASQDQQKQIVAKIEELFSHIDAGIESLKIAKEKLKQYRQSVLKAAVTGELTKDWRQANKDKIEPANQLLQRILKERRQRWEQQQLDQFATKGQTPKNDNWKEKYKEPDYNEEVFFDDIPSNWSSATIDTLAFDVRYGSSSKTNDDSSGVPVIRMGNIIDGKLDFSNLKYLPVDHQEFPELLLSDRDLLFNRTNSAELVGKTAIFFDKGRPVSLASYVIRVRLLSGVESQFVANFINSTIGRAWIKSCVSQNVGQANVNGTKLKALVVPLPPLKEQKEIVRIVEDKLTAADRLMNEIDTKLTQAQQQKQATLASAFKGKLH